MGDIRTSGRLQPSQTAQGRPLGGGTQVCLLGKPSRQGAFRPHETRQQENQTDTGRHGQEGQDEC
jgi:hypothetical protein